MTTFATLTDQGSTLDTPVFLALLASVATFVLGTWFGATYARNTPKTCELCGTREAFACPPCTRALTAALEEGA